MRKLLVANYQYIAQALKIIAGQALSVTDYKLARKEVYVSSANMASAFKRMMTEPKSKRKDAQDINRFVVFNHLQIGRAHVRTQVTNAQLVCRLLHDKIKHTSIIFN